MTLVSIHMKREGTWQQKLSQRERESEKGISINYHLFTSVGWNLYETARKAMTSLQANALIFLAMLFHPGLCKVSLMFLKCP